LAFPDGERPMTPRLALLLAITLLAACSGSDPATHAERMNGLAERYVHLVLGVGEIAPGYVDAYYGPESWRETVREDAADREDLLERAETLRAELDGIARPEENMAALRHDYLGRQLDALIAYLEMLGGTELSFDAEAKALYDAEPPHFDAAHFDAILAGIDALVPGDAPLAERVEDFRAQFVIPPERLEAVFEAAIRECRTRTLMHVPLPVQESFRVEY